MMKDEFGLPVSTTDPEALRAVNDFVQGLIRYETRAADVLKAAGSRCALANIYCAILFLFSESPQGPEDADPHLKLAKAQIGGCTAREAFTLDYATCWQHALQTGDYQALFKRGEEAIALYPDDLVLMKLHQHHCFDAGDAPGMVRAAQAAYKARSDIAQVHGMLAFGYEQCHWLAEAEVAARTALDMEKKEPWAQHALAHVMLTQGRMEEGADFLESVEGTWTGLNSFMLTHLWWHRALFYISLGRFEDALNVYDHHTLNADPSYSQDQIGAISLLARLELAGIEIGDRWIALGNLIRKRAQDAVQPFLSLQYLYCFAKAQRSEAETLNNAILAKPQPVWSEIAAPTAAGLLAHARGHWDAAFTDLFPTLQRMREIGGSHAQRDLFEQIALDAAIKSKRYVIAQQMIEQRITHDPTGVPLAALRDAVNAALGIEAQLNRPHQANLH